MRLTTVATPVSMKSKRLRAVDVALIGVACRGGGTLSERRESAEKVRNGTADAVVVGAAMGADGRLNGKWHLGQPAGRKKEHPTSVC